MSNWCQFCDKEMRLEESIVYIQEYITCGHSNCERKAKEMAKAIYEEQNRKEEEIVIFKTMTPKDDKSWRVVPVDEHPEFLSEPFVMTLLIEGQIANIYHPNSLKEVYYCARKKLDVINNIKLIHIEEESDDDTVDNRI